MDTQGLPPLPKKQKPPFSPLRSSLELVYLVGLALVAYAQWFSNPEVKTHDTTGLGAGLAIASFLVTIYLVANKIRYFADFRRVKTVRRNALFVIANLSWISYLPLAYCYYYFRQQQGHFPVSFDILKAMVPQPLTAVLLVAVLNLFVWLTNHHVLLPCPLFPKIGSFTIRHFLWEMLFIPVLLFNQVFLYYAVVDGGQLLIPLNLVLTYVFLVLRAGRISQAFQPSGRVSQHAIHKRLERSF